MIRIIVLAALCFVASTAIAQQPQQQTPTQTALQINVIIGQWAQALEALQSQNAELQKQLAELKAQAERK